MAFCNHRKCFVTAVSPAAKASTIMMPLPSEPLLCQRLGGTVHSTVQNPILGPEGSSLWEESRPQIMHRPSKEQAVQGPPESEGRGDVLHGELTSFTWVSPAVPIRTSPRTLIPCPRGNVIPEGLLPAAEPLPAHCSPLDSCPSFFGLCKLPKK